MGSGEYHRITRLQEHCRSCALGGALVESPVCTGGGGRKSCTDRESCGIFGMKAMWWDWRVTVDTA